MVIYEVNINVNNKDYKEYSLWLNEHIDLMLEHKGFIKADKYQYKTNNNDVVNICVQYLIKSMDELNLYIKSYSIDMRNDINNNFLNKVDINRRILEKNGSRSNK